jgi:hypothetical protein
MMKLPSLAEKSDPHRFWMIKTRWQRNHLKTEQKIVLILNVSSIQIFTEQWTSEYRTSLLFEWSISGGAGFA